MRGRSRIAGMLVVVLIGTTSCASPEARRLRDGGPGADIGNTKLTDTPPADPQAADTTLWPGRAIAPVERLARGEMPPPAGVSPASVPQIRARPPAPP
jgi:hypothetical protein